MHLLVEFAIMVGAYQQLKKRVIQTGLKLALSWKNIKDTTETSAATTKTPADTMETPTDTTENILRGCAKWFFNISAMQEMKVPSEIVYTNI